MLFNKPCLRDSRLYPRLLVNKERLQRDHSYN